MYCSEGVAVADASACEAARCSSCAWMASGVPASTVGRREGGGRRQSWASLELLLLLRSSTRAAAARPTGLTRGVGVGEDALDLVKQGHGLERWARGGGGGCRADCQG